MHKVFPDVGFRVDDDNDDDEEEDGFVNRNNSIEIESFNDDVGMGGQAHFGDAEEDLGSDDDGDIIMIDTKTNKDKSVDEFHVEETDPRYVLSSGAKKKKKKKKKQTKNENHHNRFDFQQFRGNDDDDDSEEEEDEEEEEEEEQVAGFTFNMPHHSQQQNLEKSTAGLLDSDGNGKEKKKHNDLSDDVDDDDEIVDFLGMDDGAEEIVGIAQLPGTAGGFINPEIEKRVSQLADTLRKYKEKNKQLRDKLSRTSEMNKKLKEDIERVEEEKEEAELKAERELRMIQYKNMGGAGVGGGGRNLAGDLEAQRKRDEARRQMYSNADQGEDDALAFGLDDYTSNLGFLGQIYKKVNIVLRKHFPLNRDLRRIDARFGSSVASYFFFFRWMITNYMSTALICLIFLVRHILSLLIFQYLSPEEKQTRYNSAKEPATYYDWTNSDWAKTSSFLPKFLMPSSFNPGDTATIYIKDNLFTGTPIYDATGELAKPVQYETTMEFGERMDYISMLMFCNIIFLISAIIKWVREDRKSKSFELLEDMDDQNVFANVCLNAWDHSLTDKREVEDMKHSLLDQYFLMLHDYKTADLQKNRSIQERLILYARRTTANLLYLGIQGSSAYAIILLTTKSAEFSQYVLTEVQSNPSFQWLSEVVNLLSGSIVPIAVSILNGMLPAIIKVLTTFEKWDDGGFYTKLMLFRLFVAKSLNALIQIFSFIQLLDPYFLRGTPLVSVEFDRTARVNTEKRLVGSGQSFPTPPNGNALCRADLYGAGVFQLVLTEFVVSKFGFFAGPFAGWLVSKIRKKSFERKEFEVAKQMVNLLFFQQLCFMSFPFFPFGTILILGMMFAGFKIEKKVLYAYMAKPKKPWSAKDAANFFIKFFFFTFAVSIGVTSFVLSNQNFPKACNLQEHITQYTFNQSHPLSQCFKSDVTKDDETCFLNERKVNEIKAGQDRAPGLEELRIWEEYFVHHNASVVDNKIDTEKYLRETMGMNSSEFVSFPSLLVCSLSCGPFMFNLNPYAPLDSYLTIHLKAIYTLATQNPIFIWGIAIVILLRYIFVKNTINVLYQLQAEKEISLRNLVANLESKIKKLHGKVEKLKQS